MTESATVLEHGAPSFSSGGKGSRLTAQQYDRTVRYVIASDIQDPIGIAKHRAGITRE